MRGSKVQSNFKVPILNVGVIKGPRKHPLSNSPLKSLGSTKIKARRVGKKTAGVNSFQLAKRLEKKYKFFSKPFKKPDKNVKNALDILVESGLNNALSTRKRAIENSFIALIRNPILKNKYGKNTKTTRKIKGFNKLGIDTGQFFNSIEAKVKQ